MARNFQSNADPLVGITTQLVSFKDTWFSCWFRAEDDHLERAILDVSAASDPDVVMKIGIDGSLSGDPVFAGMGTTSGNYKKATTTRGYITNQWHSLVAFFREIGTDEVYVWLDGEAAFRGIAVSATHPIDVSVPKTTIGDTPLGGGPFPFKGDIAEVRILRDYTPGAGVSFDDVAHSLAQPDSPIRYLTGKQWVYAPILGTASPEPNYGPDPIGPATSKPVNFVVTATTVADHAPIGVPWGWDTPPLRPGKGTTTVTPTAVSMSLDVVTPTTIYNDLITPTPVSMSLDAVTPAAIGVAITPPAVSMSLDTVVPSVARIITPTPVAMSLDPFTDILDGGIVDVRKEIAIKRTIVLPSPRTRLLG